MKMNEDFGTNPDDSKNKEYCKFCFKEGQFTDEGITMEQKIEENIMIAKGMGIPEDQALAMTREYLGTLTKWSESLKGMKIGQHEG